MKALILAAVVAISGCSTFKVGTINWSEHFGSKNVTNETHNGVYVGYQGFLAGTYKNSYGHQTQFVGYEYKFASYKDLDFSIAGGAMNGYPDDAFSFDWDSKDITPFLAPSVKYKFIKVATFGKALTLGFEHEFE